MIIYKDKLFGDELFTDASKPKLDEDGICFVFDTKTITVKEGDIDGALLGANASQEEASEESEVATVSGFDFVIANRLKEVEPAISDKKSFQFWAKTFFKQLMEKVKAENPDKLDEIKAAGPKFVTAWAAKAKDLSFYGAEPREDDEGVAVQGNIVVVEWNDDGITGKAHCLKAGLVEEEV